jgi:hypothetical protein
VSFSKALFHWVIEKMFSRDKLLKYVGEVPDSKLGQGAGCLE